MFSELTDRFWSKDEPIKTYSDVLPAGDVKNSSNASPIVYPNLPPVAPCKEDTAGKISKIARPILKTLGLILLFGAVRVLKAYSLVDPVIMTEMTRLIFLCVIALILQKTSDSADDYRNRIVGTVVFA